MNLADKIVMRPVGALVPYASNSRTHTPAQLDKLARSISEFGFTNPILVDGENGVIAGHARLAVAQKLGLAEVPTIDLFWLTPAQRQALCPGRQSPSRRGRLPRRPGVEEIRIPSQRAFRERVVMRPVGRWERATASRARRRVRHPAWPHVVHHAAGGDALEQTGQRRVTVLGGNVGSGPH